MRKRFGIAICILTLVIGGCACNLPEDLENVFGDASSAEGTSNEEDALNVEDIVNPEDATNAEETTNAENTAGAEETKNPEDTTTPVTEEDIQPTKEPQETVVEEKTPLFTKTYTPSEKVLKVLGRAAFTENTLWLVHSGSGAEFEFVGTKAIITFQGDSTAYSGSGNQTHVGVFVNGECVSDFMMDKKEKKVTVFESEEPMACTITVVKLSEAPSSTVGIKSIEAESESDIKPTPVKEHYIEFIGDSITCGYGVEDENRDHHFSTETENATKTYAYKTAQALDADYSLVSLSGYGIISGYSGDGQKHGEQVLSKYYDKLGFSYGSYLGDTPYNTEWDFAKRQPDVIVINLGTNDESYTGTDQARRDEFVEGYVAFLKQVREKNPDAVIFATLGIMGDALYPSVQKAVEQYRAETGDEKVHTMRFDVQSMSDGIAADWHPTEKTHAKAANKLVKEIQAVMGW